MCDDCQEIIANYKVNELLIDKQFDKQNYKNQFQVYNEKSFLLLDVGTFTYIWYNGVGLWWFLKALNVF